MVARKVYTIAAMLALGGCASVQIGHDFNSQKFQSSVQRGVTTESDVHQWLGEPSNTGVVADAATGKQYTRWVYYYGSGKPPTFDDVSFKNLEVLFDEHKLVQGYQWAGGK